MNDLNLTTGLKKEHLNEEGLEFVNKDGTLQTEHLQLEHLNEEGKKIIAKNWYNKRGQSTNLDNLPKDMVSFERDRLKTVSKEKLAELNQLGKELDDYNNYLIKYAYARKKLIPNETKKEEFEKKLIEEIIKKKLIEEIVKNQFKELKEEDLEKIAEKQFKELKEEEIEEIKIEITRDEIIEKRFKELTKEEILTLAGRSVEGLKNNLLFKNFSKKEDLEKIIEKRFNELTEEDKEKIKGKLREEEIEKIKEIKETTKKIFKELIEKKTKERVEKQLKELKKEEIEEIKKIKLKLKEDHNESSLGEAKISPKFKLNPDSQKHINKVHFTLTARKFYMEMMGYKYKEPCPFTPEQDENLTELIKKAREIPFPARELESLKIAQIELEIKEDLETELLHDKNLEHFSHKMLENTEKFLTERINKTENKLTKAKKGLNIPEEINLSQSGSYEEKYKSYNNYFEKNKTHFLNNNTFLKHATVLQNLHNLAKLNTILTKVTDRKENILKAAKLHKHLSENEKLNISGSDLLKKAKNINEFTKRIIASRRPQPNTQQTPIRRQSQNNTGLRPRL
ncbi:hypothetical protein [Abyssalbus ytuae]|uniref:Uncharacterized protein n=1 Tax=Abyssalbus ytuae TaxID=2926907 RepID=A0A9E6ZUD6_9FLAO|nr:hypothetical protein [Abyssalbus ytuae]UOB16906.1 hypothetical protein MQE35_14340 [Abyssalbus ytuae]